jgi:hypothetical protein
MRDGDCFILQIRQGDGFDARPENGSILSTRRRRSCQLRICCKRLLKTHLGIQDPASPAKRKRPLNPHWRALLGCAWFSQQLVESGDFR